MAHVAAYNITRQLIPVGCATETTPLSFLGYLQKTLKPYVGLIRFTDGDKDNLMHEVNIRHVDTSNLECSSTQMYTFLEFYFEAVCLPLPHPA